MIIVCYDLSELCKMLLFQKMHHCIRECLKKCVVLEGATKKMLKEVSVKSGASLQEAQVVFPVKRKDEVN